LLNEDIVTEELAIPWGFYGEKARIRRKKAF
jgi:hypothetical protein